MSNRYIPYGYKFEAGQPVPYPDESQIVGEIFHRYCAGDSLKLIAEDLTHRQLEYSPGKTSWDKARIKRILENSRYTKLFKELTVCAKCGKKVTRRTDSRSAEPVSWKCSDCGWSVRLSDDGFKAQVITIMNTLIDTPDTASPDDPAPEVRILESKRLLNEFHRALDSRQASEGELIKMVFEIGAANYQAIDSRESITARLMADFAKSKP